MRRRYQRDGWLRVEGDGWRLRYRIYDAAGKPHRRDVRIANAKATYIKGDKGKWRREGPFLDRAGLDPAQAQQLARTQYLDKVQEHNANPQQGTAVEKFWRDNYLPNATLRKLAPKTMEQYTGLFGKWIRPVIGHLSMSAVDLEIAEFVLAGAREAGLSDETVKHIRKVGSALFTRAIKTKAYSGFNPFQAVDLGPRVEPVRERYALTPARARMVLDHPKWTARSSPRYVDAVRWALLTGMNIAEICGLTGEHVLEDRITVRQQYYRGRYGPLKTKARKRDIPLTEELRHLLDEHGRSAEGTGNPPLFAGQNNRPLNEHNIQRRYLRPIGDELGLPSLGWHICRHTFATWLQQAGVDSYDRKRLLGHSGDVTDGYTHEDMDRLRAAMEVVGRKLEGVEEKVVEMPGRKVG